MSQQLLTVASVAILSSFPMTAVAQPGTAIRPEHPDLQQLIDDGGRRSATFQGLIARLDATAIIVYVRFDRCGGGVAACTRVAASHRNTRRLLIVLDRFGRGPSALIALLAHELQHAIELSEAPQVVDETSLRLFCATSGWQSREGCETAEALRVGRAVASEMATRRSR